MGWDKSLGTYLNSAVYHNLLTAFSSVLCLACQKDDVVNWQIVVIFIVHICYEKVRDIFFHCIFTVLGERLCTSTCKLLRGLSLPRKSG